MINPAKKRKRTRRKATKKRAKKRATKKRATKRKPAKRKAKKRGGKKRTAYQSFVSREMKSLIKQGKKPKTAMREVAKMWRAKKGGRKAAPKRRKRKATKKRGRGNWGTRAGGRKGWSRRESRSRGYSRTRGAKYPKTRGKKRKSNPRRKGRMTKSARSRAARLGWRRRRRGKANTPKRRYKRKKRSNPARRSTARKISAHVSTPYGRAHMKFISSCLRQRGGKGGMKYCQKAWRKQRKGHGRPQPKHRRRANPSRLYRPIEKYVEPATTKLGFPRARDMFPTFEEVKGNKLATGGGVVLGIPSALVFGGMFRMAAKDKPVAAEILSTTGGVFGTELTSRIWKKWGPAKASKPTMVKAIRLSGYGTTLASTIFGIVRLYKAKGTGGAVSGLGDIKDKVKAVSKKVVDKAKKALGMGIFGSKRGMGDVVTSGWEQGYTGYQPLGVSGLDETMSKLDAKIKEIAKDLGLSDVEVSEMMAKEGYDVGYLDYQMAGWGEDPAGIYELGRYETYVTDPYAPPGEAPRTEEAGYGLGQYGSPSVPLLSDATVPPAEKDIFRDDFVV